VDHYSGIFPPYEAFYIHSIMYEADRVLAAFEQYGELRSKDASWPDQVSAIHEALGHAGALSRFFWPSRSSRFVSKSIQALREARAGKLRLAFRMGDESPLKDRRLRDALEHFDERLDKYLLTSGAGEYAPVPRIGDSEGLPDGANHVFKLVDPSRSTFLILDVKLQFGGIREEAARVLLETRRMMQNGARLLPTE
jgi:hypothetical protein